MTPTTRTATLALATGALALTLTACAAPSAPTPTAATPTAAAATAAPVVDAQPAPAPTATETAPALAVGSAVTDPAILAACDPAKLPLGIIDYGEGAGKCTLPKTQRVYVDASGTAVLVDRDQPLPAAVAGELEARAAGAVPTDTVTNRAAVLDAIKGAASSAGTATGKSVVLVVALQGTPGCAGGQQQRVYGAVLASGSPIQGSKACAALGTADEALAAAEAYVAGRDDAATWIVVPAVS